MLRNIDKNKFDALMANNDDARDIINTLLDNHKLILSTISHEIRNPLTTIYSNLQLLSSKHPELANIKKFDSIVEDVEYMKILLEELSTYNNSQILKLESIDFTSFLQKVLLSFAISIEDSEISLTSSIATLPYQITVDKTKLQEVFLNILKNAKEAITPTGHIDLNLVQQPDSIVITISNDGAPIPHEYIGTIFEPFKTYKEGGTGLGLAISKQVIESHGGNISVLSSAEHGTSFTIQLPII